MFWKFYARGLGATRFDFADLESMSDVRFRPILLKKSIMVSTAEKYVLEIEIFALSTGLPGSDVA